MDKRKIVLISIAGAILFYAIAFVATLMNKGYILPWYLEWQDRFISSDGYDIVLKNRHLEVYEDAELVWELNPHIKVQDVIVTDVDRDGFSEITVLCWKNGKYGKYKPLFARDTEAVADDSIFYTEHIFVYNLTENGPEPKWMAADIGEIVLSIESPNGYILRTHEKDGDIAEWMWVSWGFTKVN